MKNKILTGSFCEFRGNHFHTGIDISTYATVGMPVYAPTDGYISYIKQDFLGYGKAIFLENDSLIFVFAHLSAFSDKISNKLNPNKYRQKIYLNKNELKIKKGELIAYAGRSGTYIPHLHFEVRNKNNHPVNPLNYFTLYDNHLPEIKSIIIEPADDTTLINGKHEIVKFKCKKLNNNFYIINNVNIKGNFYISIEIIDKLNSPSARLFIKNIDIYSCSKRIYTFTIDSVSFELSKKSPLLFRNDLPLNNKNYIFYPHAKGFDYFAPVPLRKLTSNKDSIIKINVIDNYHNLSSITFKIINKNILPKKNDFVKISKINNKICFILSGKYNELKSIYEFTKYKNGRNYSYYIYNGKKNIHTKLRIKNKKINTNIVYIDSIHKFINNDFLFTHKKPIYFLYDTISINIKGFIEKTPVYKFYYLNRYIENPIECVIKNKSGYSLYFYKNNKFSFIRKLTQNDTFYFNYIRSFIIGKDINKPIFKFISKKIKNNYIEYKYFIFDSISGIDWIFVSDSNNIYNIPDPQKNTIKIRINKNDSIFVIKDKEGNKDTIFFH